MFRGTLTSRMSLILKSLFWRPNWALFVAFMCIVSTSHAESLDSLKQVIAGMEPGMDLAEVHLELADEYSNRALYNEQLEECEKALKLSKKFGSDLERARVMLRVGLAHSNLDEHDKAISFMEKGMRIYTSNRDEQGVAKASTELGMVLSRTGEDYREAKEYLVDALPYHHEHGDVEMLVDSYYTLGGIAYSFEQNPSKTLKHYYRVIELRRGQSTMGEVKDNMLAGAYNNSGLIYLYGEEYPLAIEYMKKALDCLPEDGNQKFRAVMNINLAYLYRKTEEFDVAHHHLNVVIEIASELDIVNFVQLAHDWRCEMSLEQGQLDSTLHYLAVAQEYSKQNGSTTYDNVRLLGDVSFAQDRFEEAGEFYNMALDKSSDDAASLLGASKCAKAQGDYALALSLRERYHMVEDSLREMRRVPAISLSETRQEVSLMEKEERRRVEQEREEAKSRNFLQYSAGLLLIVILLLLLNLVVKLTLPSLVIKAASFITVLTLFEFALVYLDPTIEAASGGQPLAKLGINLLIATVIFPLHTFIEGRIAKAYG